MSCFSHQIQGPSCLGSSFASFKHVIRALWYDQGFGLGGKFPRCLSFMCVFPLKVPSISHAISLSHSQHFVFWKRYVHQAQRILLSYFCPILKEGSRHQCCVRILLACLSYLPLTYWWCDLGQISLHCQFQNPNLQSGDNNISLRCKNVMR